MHKSLFNLSVGTKPARADAQVGKRVIGSEGAQVMLMIRQYHVASVCVHCNQHKNKTKKTKKILPSVFIYQH